MKNEVKRLFVYTTVSFILLIVIWLLVGLLASPNSYFGMALSVISIIPYAYYGTKLLSKFELDKFYNKL